eukprot:scaffold394_cov237-Pinguiococcus_pyrenoidosus.AAC.8
MKLETPIKSADVGRKRYLTSETLGVFAKSSSRNAGLAKRNPTSGGVMQTQFEQSRIGQDVSFKVGHRYGSCLIPIEWETVAFQASPAEVSPLPSVRQVVSRSRRRGRQPKPPLIGRLSRRTRAQSLSQWMCMRPGRWSCSTRPYLGSLRTPQESPEQQAWRGSQHGGPSSGSRAAGLVVGRGSLMQTHLRGSKMPSLPAQLAPALSFATSSSWKLAWKSPGAQCRSI